MGIRLRLLAVLAVVGVLSAVSLASADDSRHHGKRVKVIDLTSRTVQSAELDLGAAGFGIGDRFVFADELYENGRRVGELGGECTFVHILPNPLPANTEPTSTTANCVVSARLAKGQITVQGLVTFTAQTAGRPFTLAVTGGTGAYATARGEVQVTETSATESNIQVRLVL